MTILLTLWRWLRNIPVLFAHFPGPSLLLVAIACAGAASLATCTTHKLEAGARADLRAQLAEAKSAYADRRANAAEQRESNKDAAHKEQRAIDTENQRAWFAQLAALNDHTAEAAQFARMGKLIEGLHHDPAFDCRRLPLPSDYIHGMYLESYQAGKTPGKP